MGAFCSEENSIGADADKSNVRRKVHDAPREDSDQGGDAMDANEVVAESEDEMDADEVIVKFEEYAHAGNTHEVMSLDQQYADLNLLDTKFANGDSLLHVAVRNKNHKMILYCLENGLKPNEPNEQSGDNALHMAVWEQDVRIATILLKYGADPTRDNLHHKTPIDIANELKDDNLIELLDTQTFDAFSEGSRGTFHSEWYVDDDGDAVLSKSDVGHEDSINDILAGNEDAKEPASKSASTLSTPAHPGFKHLKRTKTKSAINLLSDLEKKKFKELKSWLDKRNNSLPFNWHSRWVIVKESFMLWSDVQMKCGDPKDKKERNKFKYISLLQVESVERMDSGKNHTKFKVVVSGHGDKKREYLWRCKAEEDRNRWVIELQYRVEHAKNVVDFMSEDVADLF